MQAWRQQRSAPRRLQAETIRLPRYRSWVSIGKRLAEHRDPFIRVATDADARHSSACRQASGCDKRTRGRRVFRLVTDVDGKVRIELIPSVAQQVVGAYQTACSGTTSHALFCTGFATVDPCRRADDSKLGPALGRCAKSCREHLPKITPSEWAKAAFYVRSLLRIIACGRPASSNTGPSSTYPSRL